jgi:hypothetical protein
MKRDCVSHWFNSYELVKELNRRFFGVFERHAGILYVTAY